MTETKPRKRQYRTPLPDIPTAPPPEDVWDGTRTEFKVRNTTILYGPVDDDGRALDRLLLADGDIGEWRCAEVTPGRWVGPDADQVVSLLSRGFLTGVNGDTAEARKLAQDVTLREVEWGVDPDPVAAAKDGPDSPGARGKPELRAARTKAFMESVGGPGPFALRNRLKLDVSKRLEAGQVAESRAQDEDRTRRLVETFGAKRRRGGLAEFEEWLDQKEKGDK